MNQTTKRMARCFALLMVGASLYLTGCGPENFDDAAYLSELGDISLTEGAVMAANGVDSTPPSANHTMNRNGNGANRNGNAMNARGQGQNGRQHGNMGRGRMGDDRMGQDRMHHGRMGRDGLRGGAVAGEDVAVAGAEAVATPVVGAAVAAVPAVPVEIIALPDQYVELPPVFEANPPIVTTSGELIGYNQRTFVEQPVHVSQPMVNEHLVTTNLNTQSIYHTTVINHPSFVENVAFAQTYSVTPDEILPTTVLTEPTVVLPGIVEPGCAGPVVAPYAPLWDLGFGF